MSKLQNIKHKKMHYYKHTIRPKNIVYFSTQEKIGKKPSKYGATMRIRWKEVIRTTSGDVLTNGDNGDYSIWYAIATTEKIEEITKDEWNKLKFAYTVL